MKYIATFILLLVLISCKEEIRPKYNTDFTDRAINLALQNPGNIVELPGLYPHYETIVALEKDEQWQLADRLVTRGFKERRRETQAFSLSGQQIVSIIVADSACDCKVSKIYRTTPYTSRYEVSERIVCLNKD
jgi:hypothetical protein